MVQLNTVFRKSESALIINIALLWSLAAFAVMVAIGTISIPKHRELFWLPAAFFIFIPLGWVWELLFLPDTSIEVGPDGIRDERASPDWIRWDAVEAITEREWRWSRFLLLRLTPDGEKSFRPSLRRKLMGGWKDIYISPQGTKGNYADLLAAVQAVVPERLAIRKSL